MAEEKEEEGDNLEAVSKQPAGFDQDVYQNPNTKTQEQGSGARLQEYDCSEKKKKKKKQSVDDPPTKEQQNAIACFPLSISLLPPQRLETDQQFGTSPAAAG